ncbi:predicted protein [Nematostella vectensis]|uniref:Uncharacterized protein n=1 Tax=Nematostella vectensis TaxID=45351 RepID=A7SWG2_NEMVE|nr:predicted protein [Nematostella vectensis]|eukprot:XP_001624047.1 predicted protein [Nematostella vectensis]
MAVGVFLLVGTVITNAYAVGSGIGEPAYCTTRPQALPVDPIHNRYLPYFALIYQCGGGCLGSPKILTCRNISSEEVFVDVLDEITLSMVRLKMYNHTKCNCGCTTSPMDCSQHQRFDENQCRCTCDLPDAPCEKDFIWDKDLCKCRCNRAPIPCGDDSKIRLWDEESCGCTCSQRVVKRCARKNKDLDLSTCQCVDVQALQRVNQSNESRDRMYITFLVLCGFCIIVLVCIMVHYIRKSPGDVRKLPEKTRLDSNSNGSIALGSILNSYQDTCVISHSHMTHLGATVALWETSQVTHLKASIASKIDSD